MERTWGQWVEESADDALEWAEGAVRESAKGVVDSAETLVKTTGVGHAIDTWSMRAPDDVTREFRDSLGSFASERAGPLAGAFVRLQSVPFSAAARFSVESVRSVDQLAGRATDIATGRAPLPTPGEVIRHSAVGLVRAVDATLDAVGDAAIEGAVAAVDGDLEGLAAAAEDGLKAGFDAAAMIASARGFAAGFNGMTGSVGVASATHGATMTVARGSALAGAAQGLGSAGTMAVLTQAPIESRGRGRRGSAHFRPDANRPPRRYNQLLEWPVEKTPRAKPYGSRASTRRNTKNASPDEVRSLRREDESADLLAREGFDVEQLPKVVNLEDSRLTARQLGDYLGRHRADLPELVEVWTIRSGELSRVYPRPRS
ncbi:MAG: hypothetical protein AAF658_01025 [Myxococcota bacterium]